MAENKDEALVDVVEAYSKTEKYIDENQKSLTVIVGAIVLIVGGFFAYKKMYVEPLEVEAQSQMFMAEKYFESDSLNLALFGDGNYPGFLDIIDDYSLTETANLAKYYAGISYLNMGDFESAKPLCLVVKVSPVSKFMVGDLVNIKRVNLARVRRRA